MTRRHFAFDVAGSECMASLDDGHRTTGLVIVTGGNEIRSGPAGIQAALAARFAERGYPVLRYDRRGIGDSEGENAGYRGAGQDLAAAIAAFRSAAPTVERIVAYGNCDAASLLMLKAGGGADALALANPWTFEDDAAPELSANPQALREHYRQRLKSGSAIKRVLRGEVKIGAAVKSLLAMLRPAPPASGLVDRLRSGLERFDGPAAILIAERDRTGQQFRGSWPKDDRRIDICADATHAFVEPASLDWIEERLLNLLEG